MQIKKLFENNTAQLKHAVNNVNIIVHKQYLLSCKKLCSIDFRIVVFMFQQLQYSILQIDQNWAAFCF